MPSVVGSRYPFAADGKATWPSDTPYIDAMVALALIAGATARATLGTAVLVLPQRQPVELAKQAASLDALSGGRLCLGVGAGWLAEEFVALQVPFASRGERFEEWIALLRACWTGTPPAHNGAHYRLPAGVLCYPTPVGRIPFLVGGHSPVALRRAATIAEGWLAHQSAAALDLEGLAAGTASMRAAAEDAGRDPSELRTTLRIIDSATRIDVVADALPLLADAGVDEVVVDVDWTTRDAAKSAFARLASAAGA